MRPLTLFLTSLVDTIAAKLVKCCDVHARLKLSSVFSAVFVSTPSVDHIPSPILHVQSEYTCWGSLMFNGYFLGIIKDGIVMVKIVGDLQNTHNINCERWICPLFSVVSYLVGRQTVNYFCPSSHVLFSEKHITQHRTGNILELVSWHKNTNTLALTYGSEKFQKTHLGFAEFSIWWRNHS